MPITSWLPRYDRAWLPLDVIAGLTVRALVVPESMAYAGIAGVPAQYGLYAVPPAVLGYHVFASSRQLFVGPSAIVASISTVAVGRACTRPWPKRWRLTREPSHDLVTNQARPRTGSPRPAMRSVLSCCSS